MFGRTPLYEGSACRRGLYLSTHHIENRQTSTSVAGFEPTVPPSERPEAHALDRAVNGIGNAEFKYNEKFTDFYQGLLI